SGKVSNAGSAWIYRSYNWSRHSIYKLNFIIGSYPISFVSIAPIGGAKLQLILLNFTECFDIRFFYLIFDCAFDLKNINFFQSAALKNGVLRFKSLQTL
ncbi:MAG: hypothetical protein QW292_13100, partial [Candidatus Parvarchaeota archaeon]